ncbi:Copper transport protein ctr5 [Schizosaccharomyces pombe]
MSMSGMSGMSMGSSSNSSAATCRMSMLWNWYIHDSCFLAKSWHINTGNKFAGSIIGIFFFAVAIEGLSLVQRMFDRWIVAHSNGKTLSGPLRIFFPCSTVHVTVWQQLIRAAMYSSFYLSATILMLIVMSFNGYAILFGFVGAWIGFFLFASDTYGTPSTGTGCCESR